MYVLIVEDDPTTSKIIQSYLTPEAKVETALNGEEGFDKFATSFRDRKRFDLICLDIHLPGVDGLELLAGIRELEESYKVVGSDATKVIVISSDEAMSTVYDAMAHGCVSYLIKPLERSKFVEELHRLGLAAA